MKTISFIGSDKNAGKTTVFNFVHRRLHKSDKGCPAICLTSIGINGEDVDVYEGHSKPHIQVVKGTLFVTAAEHLNGLAGKYIIQHIFSSPDFSKLFVLGRCLLDFPVVLEGPNDKQEILRIKNVLQEFLPQGHLLIDGSIDRQFLAHPQISDEIYFSVLISGRVEQRQKARDLLFSLSIRECSPWIKALLQRHLAAEDKTLFFDEEHRVVYRGLGVPFLDEELKTVCSKFKNQKSHLYLNGALSKTLFNFLAPFRQLEVVLDNFTLYQNISVQKKSDRVFRPKLSLLNPILVKKIFLRQMAGKPLDLPANIPALNLFGDNLDEIGV